VALNTRGTNALRSQLQPNFFSGRGWHVTHDDFAFTVNALPDVTWFSHGG
jgi:hypothetical protein